MKNALELLFTSKVRAEILRLLFSEPPARLHLRDIARHAGVTAHAVQKEIQNLKKQDLLQESRDGNRIYYVANSVHPIYIDLKNIVLRLVGPVPVLKEALQADEIQFAFIFGSIARGEAKASSDVDLIVIGDLGLRRVTSLLSGVSDKLGREINPHVYSKKEYLKRIQSQDHFLTRVLETKKQFIIGSEHELEGLGKLRLAKEI
jgi:predicted nucleotidyltransferase